MASITIELTNRCNLRCRHCFDGRHRADGDLDMMIIEKILNSAKAHGFQHLSFTGGEPTLHSGFFEILQLVYEAGYTFGFVSNGWNFTGLYERLLPYRERLGFITFSLDGVREETHDRLRGKGSYRRVVQAITICMIKEIPFTLNMVITSQNRGELEEMKELAVKLGSHGLRFGHLLSNPSGSAQELYLSPEGRKEVEAVILLHSEDYPIVISIAPGYHTDDLFPCAPLQMKEFNIDWRGNVSMCCHLSGHGDGNDHVIGNLDEMSFSEAYGRLSEFHEKFRREKQAHHAQGTFEDSDYFPCWYCENYFNKVDWLARHPENPWSHVVWKNNMKGRNR